MKTRCDTCVPARCSAIMLLLGMLSPRGWKATVMNLTDQAPAKGPGLPVDAVNFAQAKWLRSRIQKWGWMFLLLGVGSILATIHCKFGGTTLAWAILMVILVETSSK